MNSKKKFVITISSLVAVIAIAVVTIVAVFAASNAGVNQTLTVRYTATDVSATVKANYIVGTTSTAMLTEDGAEELVFRPTDEEGGSLSPEAENIPLDTKTNSVVFEYIFTNDSNSIDVAIDLDTTGFSVTNMNIGYAYSYSKITDTANMPLADSFEPMMILGEAKEEGAFETLYVYVKATIANLANDASFEGNMDFALTKANPVKLSFANITDATNAALFETRIIPANTNIDSIPAPIFADGEIYTWFIDESLETTVSYPLNKNADLTVYAGLSLYTLTNASAMGMDVIVFDNLTNDKFYVSTGNVTHFAYANSALNLGLSLSDNPVPNIHSVSNGEYLIAEPGQKIVLVPSSSVSSTDDIVVSNIQPTDISTKLFYSTYGAYPQSFVGDSMNETLKTASLTATGKTYTTDLGSWTNDANLDVGMGTPGVHTATLVEYSYNGTLVAKLDSAKNCSEFAGADFSYAFNNGTIAENGSTYFFYVEPILAKAMQKNANGTYTMLTVDVIGSRAFTLYGTEDGGTYDNSWKNSDIRAYLNSTFLQESGLSDIVIETTNKNTDYYNTSPDDEDTNDKIWLASLEEMLSWLGLSDRLEECVENYYLEGIVSDLTYPQISDMAVATYGYKFPINSNGYSYSSAAWLRSPGCDTSLVSLVVEGLVFAYVLGYYDAFLGFCPAFAINL